jgi:cell division transport system permease protein
MQQSGLVTEIKLISKEDALSYYQSRQDNPLLLELVTAELLPASIELSAKNPESLNLIEEQLQQYSQIDEIVLQQYEIDQLTSWTNLLRLVGAGLTLALATFSLLIIISVISFKIGNQSRLVGILHILGASSSYIVTPYIFEGFIYGLLGSAVGWSLMYGGLLYLTPWIQSMVGEIIPFPPSWEFFAIQFGVGSSLAMFFGGFSSIIAAKKLIKK